MKLNKIIPNPNNPRVIKNEKFEKLCKSLNDFPQMMKLRPIIVDENFMIRGGNMRYKALQHLGYHEIPDEWVKQAKELTEEQLKEFEIKDNLGFGEWDWDALANDWDPDKLTQWGLDIPQYEEQKDFEEEVKDSFTLKFELNKSEYDYITECLNKITANKELALLQLLKYEEAH